MKLEPVDKPLIESYENKDKKSQDKIISLTIVGFSIKRFPNLLENQNSVPEIKHLLSRDL